MKIRNILQKDKKAVSLMVGYVLLVTIAIIMGAIVYQWMRSYVPRESIECPDGVSIYIKEVNCEVSGSDYILNLSITNNGRFNVDGYFIRSAAAADAAIAGDDLSESIVSGGSSAGGVVRWPSTLEPGRDASKAVFKLDSNIAFIEVTPIIYETIENKIRLVNCGNAKVKEYVTCS
jgi:hypothetical protein